MKRALAFSAAMALACAPCAQAQASVTGNGKASLEIRQAVGIDLTSPLIIPAVTTTAVVPVTRLVTVGGGGSTVSGAAVAAASRAAASSNATLIIYGQSGDAVSMAVPETFKVIRAGGTETLTVKTSTNSEYMLARNGVVLGGAIHADTMSVHVGGSPALTPDDAVVPGPYEGLLLVVVQYN